MRKIILLVLAVSSAGCSVLSAGQCVARVHVDICPLGGEVVQINAGNQ